MIRKISLNSRVCLRNCMNRDLDRNFLASLPPRSQREILTSNMSLHHVTRITNPELQLTNAMISPFTLNIQQRIREAFASKVASVAQDALGRMDPVVAKDKALEVAKELLASPEFQEEIKKFISENTKVFVDSVLNSDIKKYLTGLYKIDRVGRSLVHGLAYYYSTQDATCVAVMCGMILGDLLGLPTVLCGLLTTCLTRLITGVANKQTSCLKTESPNDDDFKSVTEVLTAIWQGIGVVTGISSSKPKNFSDLAASCFRGLDSTAGKTRNLMLFFSNILKVVYKLYCYAVNNMFGVKTAGRLLYQDSGLVERWTLEAQFLLKPENEYLVMNDCNWFARLTMCNLVCDYFIKEFNKAGVKDVPPSMLILKKNLYVLHQKVINLGVATAYRREPVCLWISGPPGVGKTFMKDEISVKLIRAAGVKTTGNDLFTMNVAQKHWTGAEDKAVIYYDDFATVDAADTTPETVGQFMQLISDARFAPPQASVEDKGKAISPVLVYVNGNEANPQFNCVRNDIAFRRRRHICVEVVLSPKFERAFSRIANLETRGAAEWLAQNKTEEDKMPHVQFRFRDPVMDELVGPLMTYETFLDCLVDKFVARFRESDKKYRKKMAEMSKLADATCELPLEDVLEEIKRKAALNSGLTGCSDTLKEMYRVSKQGFSDAQDMARDWLKSVTGWSMSTEAPSEPGPSCSCVLDPELVLNDSVVDDSDPNNKRLVFFYGDNDSIEFNLELCGPTCKKKSPIWHGALKRYANELGSPLILETANFICNHYNQRQETKLPPVGAVMKEYREAGTQIEKKEWAPFYTTIAAAILGFSLTFSGCMCMKYFMGFGAPKDEPRKIIPIVTSSSRKSYIKNAEIVSSGDTTTARLPSKSGITVKTSFKTQALSVESGMTFTNMVDKNICYLVLNGLDRATQSPVSGFAMRCFGIAGHWIICLKHYISKIERTDCAEVFFVNSNATCSTIVDILRCPRQELVDSEIVLIKLPSKIPLFRDIRKHIMSYSESAYLASNAIIYEKALGKPGVNYEVRVNIAQDLTYEDQGVQCVAPCAITYTWHNPGRCMSPVIACFTNHRIVGFHICGGGGMGAAEPIVAETFDCINEVLTVQMPEEEILKKDATPMVSLDTNAVLEGYVKDKFSAYPAQKTCILPSVIHGYKDITTKPAPLKPADVGGAFSPLVEGCVKHGQPPSGFDPKLLARAKDFLRDQYLMACLPVRTTVGILSEADSVIGIPGLDGYQAMELSTSEGFPYTATRPPKESNKRYLFDIRENDDGTRKLVGVDSQLRHILDRKEELRSSGVVPFTVFTDCLKDSRIPIEKYLLPGKTRIFSISPADFTIQFRQYFCDIMASQKAHRFKLEHMVGLNVHSLEWSQLARRIQEKGPKILCGDYSNFGPGLDSEVVEAVGEVWADWYEHWERQNGVNEGEIRRRRTVRRCMFEEMRHAVHLCGNILYRAPCGSPSGAPPTVNVNNDVNKLYIYMAWLECFKDEPLMDSLVSFRKHCVLYVYGDDMICNVSDEAIVRFNNEYLHSFFKRHGIKYTDETKSSTVRAYVTFNEAGFLKGTWKRNSDHPMFFDYALSEKSVTDIANWIHKAPDTIAASKQTTCDALVMSFGHGREYFNSLRQQLFAAWREKCPGEDLSLYPYDEVVRMRYEFGEDIANVSIEELVQKERKYREKEEREKRVARCVIPLMPESNICWYYRPLPSLHDV